MRQLFLIFFALCLMHANLYSTELDLTIVDVEATTIIGVEAEIDDMTKIQDELSSIFSEVYSFIGKNRLILKGLPVAITKEFTQNSWKFIAGAQIIRSNLELTGRLIYYQNYAGKAVKVVYKGPYDKMNETYEAIQNYIDNEGYEVNGFTWEEYVNNPADTKPEDLIVNIYFPIKQK